MLTSADIKRLAAQSGFDLCGITTPEIIPEAVGKYRDWLSRGLHADMAWMAQHTERCVDPAQLMPDLRSIIMLGLNYYLPNSETVPEGFGRISCYARGRDYHKVIEHMTRDFIARIETAANREVIRTEAPTFKWWVDYGPLLERAYAVRAGLGFIGKNTMLINRQFGSWIFLSEVLTSIPLEPDQSWPGDHGKCGTCRRCIDSCPAGAIIEPGVIDSSRCFSYLTIEPRVTVPEDLAPRMGSNVFGCDICQEVCPHNRKRAVPASHRDLQPARGIGEFLDLDRILALRTEDEFLELTGGTALSRRKLEGIRHNAEIVRANRNKSR